MEYIDKDVFLYWHQHSTTVKKNLFFDFSHLFQKCNIRYLWENVSAFLSNKMQQLCSKIQINQTNVGPRVFETFFRGAPRLKLEFGPKRYLGRKKDMCLFKNWVTTMQQPYDKLFILVFAFQTRFKGTEFFCSVRDGRLILSRKS